MNNNHGQHRGQALVLIVFGMVGLVGLTGLAIDGGNAYSDRRHAQNAADTAVMAAGLTRIRNPSDWNIARDAGFARASENGFDNDTITNTVNVHLCSDAAATCVLPAPEPYTDFDLDGQYDATEAYTDTNGNGAYDDAVPADFVQATITSHVNTYFAPVLGIQQLTNSVQAIAHAKLPVLSSWYSGNALVAVMPGCKTLGWPNDPFTLSGNEVSIVSGTGVFVNSTCDNAFTSSSNTTLTTDTGTCVVGGVVSDGNITPAPEANCGSQLDLALYQLPAIGPGSCTTDGQIVDTGGNNYIATPGNYSGSFPDVNPAGTLKLAQGIYCLNNASNAMNFGAGWDATTDLNGNGAHDDTEGVLFFVPNGGVNINGTASVDLNAMTYPSANIAYKGYLIYLPPTNTSTVSIEGGGDSAISGTILAPGSLVTLAGSSSTESFELQAQVIGYSIKVTGDGLLNITYDQDLQGQTYTNPLLTPYK